MGVCMRVKRRGSLGVGGAETSEVAEELVFFAPVHLWCPLPGPLGVGLLLGLGRRGTQTQAQLCERVQQVARLILTQLNRTGRETCQMAERLGSQTINQKVVGSIPRHAK